MGLIQSLGLGVGGLLTFITLDLKKNYFGDTVDKRSLS